ncbi:MAG TPA: lipid A export permease/ATP-binding protein MsbA [Vicinamibacterales bacterium]
MNEHPLRRLFGFSRPYRGLFVAALAAMLLYAGASAGVALLVKPIINEVLPGAGAMPFRYWAALILLAYLIKGVGSYFSTYLMTDVGQRVVRDIRDRLFRHILDQSAAFFGQRTTGALMSRITNDVNQVQQAVSETIGDLIREGLTAVGYAAAMFYYEWRLALVSMIGAPIVVYPLVRLGQRVRRSTRRSQEHLEYLSHLTAEAFTGHRIVKAFRAERHEAVRFADASNRLYRTNLKITSAVSVLPPIMEFLGGLAIVGLLWYGQSRVASHQTTMGDFVGFIFAAFMLYTPIKRLSRVNANMQQAIAAATRIFEVLDTHSEVHERRDARPIAPVARSIEFRDVSFSYDGSSKAVLRNVSFTAHAGQVIAIVGLSGAGKTTLVNLLPRFYDVTGGAILIDDADIREATLESLRDQIGIVTQETVLFDDTIANNIAYGRPGASRERIEAAAQTAHADEFVQALPEKYETRIGERGQRLSGGQRQRLAIARALLKDSPLLILDEATSSLDAESELLVQDALANLMRDRTAFVIAHRLSTVRRADAIVALERGQVAEIGCHDELLARPSGVYAKLYALQLFDQRRDTGDAGHSK